MNSQVNSQKEISSNQLDTNKLVESLRTPKSNISITNGSVEAQKTFLEFKATNDLVSMSSKPASSLSVNLLNKQVDFDEEYFNKDYLKLSLVERLY